MKLDLTGKKTLITADVAGIGREFVIFILTKWCEGLCL